MIWIAQSSSYTSALKLRFRKDHSLDYNTLFHDGNIFTIGTEWEKLFCCLCLWVPRVEGHNNKYNSCVKQVKQRSKKISVSFAFQNVSV